MPIFVDWLNVRCIIFTSEKVRIWRKKYPREYRIVYYQFPPLTEYPHLLQLEEILGSSGILRADLGFAVLSLFFVISYRYNIKMGVEAEILTSALEKVSSTNQFWELSWLELHKIQFAIFHYRSCGHVIRSRDDSFHTIISHRALKTRFLTIKIPDCIATDDEDLEPPDLHAWKSGRMGPKGKCPRGLDPRPKIPDCIATDDEDRRQQFT